MREPTTDAVTKILVEHHARFLAFLAPRVGSVAAAEEILQAAFVKGLEHGGELREAESAVAWFFRLLRNAIVDHARHRDAEARAIARAAEELTAFVEPDRSFEDQICACVNDLVPTLKPEYAEVLRLVELEGKPVAEAARALGTSANNTSVRLHRARQALKRQLERTCGSCTTHGCLDCSCKPRNRGV